MPIAERVLCRLAHSATGQRAEARVWVMDHGRQLAVTIDGELTTMSDECRASMERAGWTPDPTNWRRPRQVTTYRGSAPGARVQDGGSSVRSKLALT